MIQSHDEPALMPLCDFTLASASGDLKGSPNILYAHRATKNIVAHSSSTLPGQGGLDFLPDFIIKDYK